MGGNGTAELYFIAGMMILILIGSVVAVYLFVRTYRREMAEKQVRMAAKQQTPEAREETSEHAAS